MHPPDATRYNPDPRYLRGLLGHAALSQRKAAALMGISDRVLRYYLSDPSSTSYRPAPYIVQYVLEALSHRSDD